MQSSLFRSYFMRQAPDDDKGGGGGAGDDKKDQKDPGGQKDKKVDGSPDDDQGEDGGDDKEDFDKLPENAKKYIKKLRDENAKTRKDKNNVSAEVEKLKSALKKLTGDESDEDPVKVAEAKGAENDNLKLRNSMLELALEHGVMKDQREYFEFLMMKKIESLEEGEELDEDQIEEVAVQARAQGGGKGPANSSTKGDGQGDKKPKQKEGEATPEQFAKMGITERSKLFQTNRELYDRLMKSSKL